MRKQSKQHKQWVPVWCNGAFGWLPVKDWVRVPERGSYIFKRVSFLPPLHHQSASLALSAPLYEMALCAECVTTACVAQLEQSVGLLSRGSWVQIPSQVKPIIHFLPNHLPTLTPKHAPTLLTQTLSLASDSEKLNVREAIAACVAQLD